MAIANISGGAGYLRGSYFHRASMDNDVKIGSGSPLVSRGSFPHSATGLPRCRRALIAIGALPRFDYSHLHRGRIIQQRCQHANKS